MSRIGKKTIAVPKGVTVTLDGQTVSVKGPKGERSWTVAEGVDVTQGEDGLSLTAKVGLPFADLTSITGYRNGNRLINQFALGLANGHAKIVGNQRDIEVCRNWALQKLNRGLPRGSKQRHLAAFGGACRLEVWNNRVHQGLKRNFIGDRRRRKGVLNIDRCAL